MSANSKRLKKLRVMHRGKNIRQAWLPVKPHYRVAIGSFQATSFIIRLNLGVNELKRTTRYVVLGS